MSERDFAIEVVQHLQDRGYIAYWAGGCVRDQLLGLTPYDYDVATSAPPEEVTKLFRRTIQVGASFGVVEVLGPRDRDGNFLKVQVATFRADGLYIDGRRPSSVSFSTPHQDAERRDFTINGMFFDPIQAKLIDFVGGEKDLQNRVLRAIGNPEDRFEEDKLRMMRAVRMAVRFGLAIEPKTQQAIFQHANEITVVSPERITDELRKCLAHPKRRAAIELLDRLNLFSTIFSDPDYAKLFKSSKSSEGKALSHWELALMVLENLETLPRVKPSSIDLPLCFAALFFPIEILIRQGQVEPRQSASKKKQDKHPLKMLGEKCKLSTDETAKIFWLVTHFDILDSFPHVPKKIWKRLFDDPRIFALIMLHRARARAESRKSTPFDECENILLDSPQETWNPPHLITGDDLIQHQVKPGPRFKEILDQIRDAQLEEQVNTRDGAIAMMKELIERLA